MKNILIATIVVMGFSALEAWAGDFASCIEFVYRRQYDHSARIRAGVKLGDLTLNEKNQLNLEQRSIQTKKLQMILDDSLTPAECTELNSDLDIADQNIFNERHDNERGTPP